MSLSAGRVGVRADQVDSFGRVISPSFLNDIMEDLPEWTDLPVRVNGTEELIPSNPSVPVTSPILADIDYPDVRRNNQYFTYRESPTSVDGLAKIKSIKGNTLVWNQLISEQYSHTFTAGGSNQNVNIERIENIVKGHKYLYAITQTNSMSSNVRNTLQYLYTNGSNVTVNESNETNHNLNAGRYGWIFTAPLDNANNWISLYYLCHTPNVAVTIKDAILVDLTLMFGAGYEPVTADEFLSLFNLPYYDYNSGSLLSFNGSGIKTIGFNQWDEEWEVGAVDSATGENESASDRIRSKGYIKCLPNTEYFYVAGDANLRIIFYDANKTYISYFNYSAVLHSFTTPSNCCYMRFNSSGAYGTTYNNDICINISSSKNGIYEPYEENTTNLPTETYFPTGMKSAGTVYDELLPTKAITRVGAVDLGSVEWMYNGSRFNATIVNLSQEDKRLKGLCAKYPTFNGSVADAPDKSLIFSTTTNAIYIKDSSYSNTTTFKSAMSGVYLFYELATPVELPTLDFGE